MEKDYIDGIMEVNTSEGSLMDCVTGKVVG